ncbi:MAG: acyl-CoA dehydrogenase family protein [SAR324 cluster bacterium]|nr:acyl-CoA dehydrogenase family protein [SAR324 cluster bacterium]
MEISNRVGEAQKVLGQGRNLLQSCWSTVKNHCLINGRISSSRLDEFQLVCYELALSTAEITGAELLLEYAQRLRSKASNPGAEMMLEEKIAFTFCSEILHSVRSRLAARKADFGLSSTTLNTALYSQETENFCDRYLRSQSLEELGRSLLELDGRTGDSLLDEEKTIMVESFRKFAEKVVVPLAEEIHRKDLIIPDEIINPLIELGCFGLSIPMKYEGIQADDQEDNLGMIVVTEELSRASLGAAGSLITRPEIMAKSLLRGGTEEQKQDWLPKLAAGDPLCAIAITEPDFGSDVASIQLKASKTEGGWLLQGEKTWCTFGGKAGVLLTLARTNPDMSLGHRGLSLFIVEKPSSDGHEFNFTQKEGGSISGKAIPTLGYRGMHSFNVFFDDYFVPDSGLLGEEAGEGKGFYFTMAGFSGGRIQTASRANGLMQAAYEQALEYAKNRKIFGKPLSNYQLTLVKLAKMACLLTASRQFTYSVGRLLDSGNGQMEASMVKLFACKSAEWICREATQIHGGLGYAEETPVSRYFVDSRVLSIFEGAEETLALKVIAKTMIEQAD